MTSLKPCPMERWVVSLSRPRVFQRADPLTSTSPVAPPLSHGRGSFTVDLNFASESQADEFRVSGPARNALLALSPPPTPGAPHLARFSRDVGHPALVVGIEPKARSLPGHSLSIRPLEILKRSLGPR